MTAGISRVIFPLLALAVAEPALRGGATGSMPYQLHQHNETFRASDGASIGFISVTRHRAPRDGITLLIAPGLSGTAAGFVEWFARPLLFGAPALQQVVAMDWRGYGFSQGPWGPSAPPDGPTAPSYRGLSTWRLAQDLHELMASLRRTRKQGKLVLLGHSMGVNVLLQLLALHGAHVADGLVLLDDSPKNMDLSAGLVVDPTFPSELVTFTPDRLHTWLPRYMAYDYSIDVANDPDTMNLTELRGQWQPYYDLDAAILDQFHAADEGNADGNGRPSFMTQTTKGLLSWMHYLGPNNGKVMALTMVSSMEQDMTGVASQVREARVPFLWYGGEQSLLNLETIVWSAQTMAPCDHKTNHTTDLGFGSLTSFCLDSQSVSAFELLQLRGNAGVHCPWLNEDGSAKVFMDTVSGFLSRL